VNTPKNSNTSKNPIVEQLHTWIDWAERELNADRHPQGVLEDLLEDLEQLAEQLETTGAQTSVLETQTRASTATTMTAVAGPGATVIQTAGHFYGRGGDTR
jgi:hypothetical protein